MPKVYLFKNVKGWKADQLEALVKSKGYHITRDTQPIISARASDIKINKDVVIGKDFPNDPSFSFGNGCSCDAEVCWIVIDEDLTDTQLETLLGG